MKKLIIVALSSMFISMMFIGCTPKKIEKQHAVITKNSLRSNSGNASIILKDDGTIEIKGVNVEIVGAGKLILVGKQIEMNPVEDEINNLTDDATEESLGLEDARQAYVEAIQAFDNEVADEGISESDNHLPDAKIFKSTREIFAIAEKNYQLHVGGEARTLPLPTKTGETVYIVMLYYLEPYHLGKEIVYPPHRKIVINPATGELVENTEVTPTDFGMSQDAMVPAEGFGLDPDLTSDEFWQLRDRFFKISPLVWEMYKNESTHPRFQDMDILREYHAIFRRIAKAPLVPYYEAIASDMFDWLSSALK